MSKCFLRETVKRKGADEKNSAATLEYNKIISKYSVKAPKSIKGRKFKTQG